MQSSDDKQVEVIAMIFQSAAATQRSTQYGVGFYGGDPDCETWGNCRQFGILGSVFWVLGSGKAMNLSRCISQLMAMAMIMWFMMMMMVRLTSNLDRIRIRSNHCRDKCTVTAMDINHMPKILSYRNI